MTDKPTISDVAEQHIQLHEHAMGVVAVLNENADNEDEAYLSATKAFNDLADEFVKKTQSIFSDLINKLAASRASDKAAVEQLIGVPTVAQENG